MKKIYLYGSGKRCKLLLNIIEDSDYMVCGIVDSDETKWGTYINRFEILSPKEVVFNRDASVCVTFYSPCEYDEIWDKLCDEYGIGYERQLSFHDIVYDVYKKKFDSLEKIVAIEKRKVFFDASWGLGLGGVESWLKDIIERLDTTSCNNFFLLSKKNQKGLSCNIEKHILEFYYPDSMVFSMDYIEKGVIFLLSNAPCTIVFSRVNELMTAACILKEKYPNLFKIIMVDHGSCDGMYRDILSYKEAIDEYVCVSKGIGKRLREYGINVNKIFSMTVPIQYDNFHIKKYSLEQEQPLNLGYAGRLEIFEKRLDILLKLIEELERRNINYIMNIAGSGGFSTQIENFVIKRNIENRVILNGVLSRKQIKEFWKKQDVSINVSDNEGRPISNIEAMLYGAVPVVTDTVGIRDDVKNGVNGYIVPINDYRCMADKIEYLDKCREKLPLLGNQAQNDMYEKMNVDKYVKFWVNLIEE